MLSRNSRGCEGATAGPRSPSLPHQYHHRDHDDHHALTMAFLRTCWRASSIDIFPPFAGLDSVTSTAGASATVLSSTSDIVGYWRGGEGVELVRSLVSDWLRTRHDTTLHSLSYVLKEVNSRRGGVVYECGETADNPGTAEPGRGGTRERARGQAGRWKESVEGRRGGGEGGGKGGKVRRHACRRSDRVAT